MKGIILGFDASKEEGKIRGHDGNRYRFTQSEFNAKQAPISDVEVDFDAEDGMAKDIYITQEGAKVAGAMISNTVANEKKNPPIVIITLAVYIMSVIYVCFKNSDYLSLDLEEMMMWIDSPPLLMLGMLLAIIGRNELKIVGAVGIVIVTVGPSIYGIIDGASIYESYKTYDVYSAVSVIGLKISALILLSFSCAQSFRKT